MRSHHTSLSNYLHTVNLFLARNDVCFRRSIVFSRLCLQLRLFLSNITRKTRTAITNKRSSSICNVVVVVVTNISVISEMVQDNTIVTMGTCA